MGESIQWLGLAVVSLMGHDQDRVYVVIKEDEDFLCLVDGHYRPLAKPKKKRKKHVKVLGKAEKSTRLDPHELFAMHPKSGEADKIIRDFIKSQLKQ